MNTIRHAVTNAQDSTRTSGFKTDRYHLKVGIIGSMRPILVGLSLTLLVLLNGLHAVEPVADAPEATGWKSTLITDGLEHPWGMAFLPQGDLLVTERPGRLRIISQGKLHPDPIEGLPPIYARRQGGLLDVAIDPEYPQKPWIYLSYAAGNNRSSMTTIARAQLIHHRLEKFSVLYQVQPGKRNGFHYGSRIGFLSDHSLVFTIGDGHMREKVLILAIPLGKFFVFDAMARLLRTTLFRLESTPYKKYIVQAIEMPKA